jgi:creatinine amidohydrolase
MKPYILQETNWKQVKSEKYEVAVIPWGATEPHNYHLPYGTDTLETAKIAEIAAEKAWARGSKVMVLPTIPFGVQNPGQIELPFCLHVPPSTQIILFRDLLKALSNQGIKKIILLNGHGGNEFRPLIRELQAEFKNVFLGLMEWFKLVNIDDYFEDSGDHAGEMETSLIQHLFPGLVLPLDEAGEGRSKAFKLKGLNKKEAWTPRNWSKVSEDTGVGNPKKADPQKGEKYLNVITNIISDFIVELGNNDLDDLYE